MSDNQENDDLTRIENLSDFEHNEDTGVNRLLDVINESDQTQKEDSDNNEFDFSDSEEFSQALDAPPFPYKDVQNLSLQPEPETDDSLPPGIPKDNQYEDSPLENIENTSWHTHDSSDENQMSSTFDLTNNEISLSSENSESNHSSKEEFEKFSSYPSSHSTLAKINTSTKTKQSKKPPINFDDVKAFGNSISPGTISVGGNPPFAIIIKNLKYLEDADEILRILKEFQLLNEQNEQVISTGLKNGSALISQISEYAAITLAHRIRQFDIELEFGLAEALHKPQNYDDNPRGLISKENLYQNHLEALNLEEKPISPESVILATTQTLAGYHIIKYINILIEHDVINEEMLLKADLETIQNPNIASESIFESVKNRIPPHKDSLLSTIYLNLAEKIRYKAFQNGGNAVVGLNFQIQALPSSTSEEEPKILPYIDTTKQLYQITCTGNAVLVSDTPIRF